MDVKPILGTAVGLQSVALVGRAYQTIPKNLLDMRPRRARTIKVMKPKRIVKGFLDISVGTALLTPTASMINKL